MQKPPRFLETSEVCSVALWRAGRFAYTGASVPEKIIQASDVFAARLRIM
jgi:hypothetical protein